MLEEVEKQNPLVINYWYETGYCEDAPCAFNQKNTGSIFSSRMDHRQNGIPGKQIWSQKSVEISYMGSGTKVNLFETHGAGWKRLLRNIETTAYVPQWWEWSFVAIGGIMGFLGELIVTNELGIGSGITRVNAPDYRYL